MSKSKSEAARHRGVPRSTQAGEVRALRALFERAGLGAYLSDAGGAPARFENWRMWHVSIRRRLAQAEKAVRGLTPPRPSAGLTDQDWLIRFQTWGREGRFHTESDFPAALAHYRTCLEASAAQPPSS